MEVEPVKATVVPPSEMPVQSARPVKQPSRVEPTPTQEELSDAQAFAADLQAILNGEKTYDAEEQQVVPTSPTAQPQPPAPHPHDIFDKGQAAIPPQQPAEPAPMSRSHAVFDQMGKKKYGSRPGGVTTPLNLALYDFHGSETPLIKWQFIDSSSH